jgi:hypothetical protein
MLERRLLACAPLLLLVVAACGDEPSGPASAMPVIDFIAPAAGTVGTEIAIHGSDFDPAATVRFGSLASPAVELEGGRLFARAPDGLQLGARYDVSVTNPGGRTATLASAFEAVAPTMLRVNGATRPTGLIGMTLIIEGAAFGDVQGAGAVYFAGSGGQPLTAAIADPADWTDGFIVTSVPQGTADTSYIWVQTATGVTDSVEFRLINSGTFSPSLINWTATASLPVPLQGLGAVFVSIEAGAAPARYVYAVGGADSQNVATTSVQRSRVQQSGALDGWAGGTPLPAPRAYHATTAATVFNAALDTTTGAVLYVIGGRDADGRTVAEVYRAAVDLTGAVGAWAVEDALPRAVHGAGAVVFRGYLYVAGGADSLNVAGSAGWRARINADGSLGGWQALPAMPTARAYFSLVNFGPYIYAVGGESGTATPSRPTITGTETAGTDLARINLRTGEIPSWTPVSTMAKARSKHSSVFAGGALLATSGVYAGQPGSSENTYAQINSDGTLGSWQGATGAETIAAEIGISLYNQAAIAFVDESGQSHVLVIGGASRVTEGRASAAVVYY